MQIRNNWERERKKEREKILDFIHAFRERREDDQRIQPARGTLLLTNKKILSPWQPTTVIAVTGCSRLVHVSAW